MEQYRKEGRPIFYTDETYIDPHAQPPKFVTDTTILSAEKAKELGYTSGLKWNAGRGNRLLILHMIGPDGLIKDLERVYIRTNRKVQSDDYHNDFDAKTCYDWYKESLAHLPLNSVVVIDNASIHNKREEGTPTAATRKADMQQWLIEKNVDFPEKALKAQLWDIIKEELKNCPQYSIDKMIKDEGRSDITLERLPPYHCELNAIELV